MRPGSGCGTVRLHFRLAAEQVLELDEELERGAALRVRSIDVGAGAQQAEDALGAPIHRGDQGSEPSRGVDPVRVCALAQQLVERMSSRRTRQRRVGVLSGTPPTPEQAWP